jgi:hypothetical protein
MQQSKIIKQRCFKEGGDGCEGDLPVVWHFSNGENRRGATSVYIRCGFRIGWGVGECGEGGKH